MTSNSRLKVTANTSEMSVSANKSVQFVYGDISDCLDEFKLGIEFFEKGQHRQALHFFLMAYDLCKPDDIDRNKYTSYYGYLLCLKGDRAGLKLCRDAAKDELHDGDVFLNWARSELNFKSRKNAISALSKGLAKDPTHPGMKAMRNKLGVRSSAPIIRFLHRDNAINVFLGKTFRKHESE